MWINKAIRFMASAAAVSLLASGASGAAAPNFTSRNPSPSPPPRTKCGMR